MGNKATAAIRPLNLYWRWAFHEHALLFLVPGPKAACRPRLALIVHDYMYTCSGRIAECSTLSALIGAKASRVEARLLNIYFRKLSSHTVAYAIKSYMSSRLCAADIRA